MDFCACAHALHVYVVYVIQLVRRSHPVHGFAAARCTSKIRVTDAVCWLAK